MSMGDRNIAEQIASERLATEPLDVIRVSASRFAQRLGMMHKLGVIHGDVKACLTAAAALSPCAAHF